MTTTSRAPRPAQRVHRLSRLRRAVPAAAVLVLALSACGTEKSDADDPGTRTGSDTTHDTGVHRDLGIFTGHSAVGEQSAGGAVLGLPDADAVREWAKGLGLPGPVVGDIASAAREADVEDGQTLAVEVLHVGCAVATSYDVEVVDGLATAVPAVPQTDLQCLLPETSVALMVVDADVADRAANRNPG